MGVNKAQIDVKAIEKLFAAGLHLGHKKNRLHPKARKYVYRIESGVSIIDLTQTATQLTAAKAAIKKAGDEGKKILIVATKKVASTAARELAEAKGLPFITTKWPPGLLTNFETIIKNVKKLKDLRAKTQDESFAKLVKHERMQIQKMLSRLEKFYSGIATLEKLPDLLFVIDVRKEKNAVGEAIMTGTPVVAIVDTNCDPDQITYPVVANDDSPTSVQYLVSEILGAYSLKKPEKAKDTAKESVPAEEAK